jgi:hypothetical protein
MKKIKKILFVGVIGMMMTAGLILVGCKEEGCAGFGDCSYTKTGSSSTGGSNCGSSDCAVAKLKSAGTDGTAKCDC